MFLEQNCSLYVFLTFQSQNSFPWANIPNFPKGCNPTTFLTIFHTKKPALRLTFLILFILILSPILLAQRKKFLKRSYSLWLKFPCIHLLPVMLHPRIQSPFLQIIFGKIPMIRFYEGLYLIIVCHPSFLLYHRIQIIMMLRTCPLAGVIVS